MDEAIRPTFSVTTADDEEAIEAVEQTIDDETQSMAALGYHTGFLSLRETLEQTITELRRHEFGAVKVGNKDDFETIGRKTVVADLSASILEGVLAEVDNAVNAVESNGKG